jgi:hypothetical protein
VRASEFEAEKRSEVERLIIPVGGRETACGGLRLRACRIMRRELVDVDVEAERGKRLEKCETGEGARIST